MSRTRCTTLGLTLLLVACGGNAGQLFIDADPGAPDADTTVPDADPNAPDAGPSLLRFADISCLPDFANGETLVEGKFFQCDFTVEGTPGRAVTLSCEDTNGNPIVCDQTASPDIQLQPFGQNLPPVTGWFFGIDTSGLGGTTLTRVWVADDGLERATYTFNGDIIVDDAINEPPTITFTCDGVTGNAFQVPRVPITCQIAFEDPDPDNLMWSFTSSGQTLPINTPSPVSGQGPADFFVNWTWNIEANEPDISYSFDFTVNDGTVTTNATLSFRLL